MLQIIPFGHFLRVLVGTLCKYPGAGLPFGSSMAQRLAACVAKLRELAKGPMLLAYALLAAILCSLTHLPLLRRCALALFLNPPGPSLPLLPAMSVDIAVTLVVEPLVSSPGAPG